MEAQGAKPIAHGRRLQLLTFLPWAILPELNPPRWSL